MLNKSIKQMTIDSWDETQDHLHGAAQSSVSWSFAAKVAGFSFSASKLTSFQETLSFPFDKTVCLAYLY